MEQEFYSLDEWNAFDKKIGTMTRELIRKENAEKKLNIENSDTCDYLFIIHINEKKTYYYFGKLYFLDCYSGLTEGATDFYCIKAFKKHFKEDSYLFKLLTRIQTEDLSYEIYFNDLSYYKGSQHKKNIEELSKRIKPEWHQIFYKKEGLLFDARNKEAYKNVYDDEEEY